jgi:hypothetical protein
MSPPIIWPWGQSPTKVIMVRNTPPYGHARTYKISLTYLERQTSYGPDKLRWEEVEEKISLKQYVSLRSKGRMTIRRSVMYRSDLRGTLTFDLEVK